MARSRAAAAVVEDDHREIVAWYRDRLTRKAPKPDQFRWPPSIIGPTWQRTKSGHWLLPDATLGWEVLGWCGANLQHSRGNPWAFTDEQARFLLWWHAVDEASTFVYRDAILQRLKGWGKDPLAACWAAVEMLGPCRPSGDWKDGQPVGCDVPDAWVQIAAVALEQTKNTMRLFPGLFTAEAVKRYRLQIGKEVIYALGDQRMIQAVTSSPATLEGARSTAVLLNETQHWTSSNAGHDMADVIDRNVTKSPDGSARTLRITNAYEPSEDSVAQRDREAWEDAEAGESLTSGVLYDSLEAPPDAPLSAEAAPEVVRAIRGDSVWLDVDRIVAGILDTRNPPSRSRRFWYNQIVAAEDAWIDPADFDLCGHVEFGQGDAILADLSQRPKVALFLDCSKSDDATALAGCLIDTGHVVTFGMWQRPPKGRPGHAEWTVPRALVVDRVDRVFERCQVVAFFADPSHARDDETQERFWDGILDDFHRRYSDRLEVWAEPSKHSVLWDMSSPKRTEEFTAAAERCATDIGEHTLTHDADGRLVLHVRHARRYPNRFGVSLWKGHRESQKKVDLAVAMVGARMVRRLVLNKPKPKKKPRTGRMWV